jgi:sulfur-oxidizing protein SoxA
MKTIATIALGLLLIVTCEATTRLSAGEIAPVERRSGFSFMTAETQAIQNDDTANPGMLWVLDGEALWNRKQGAADRACADCHGDARVTMKGIAVRYPAFDPALGRPVNLPQRINLCRARHQQAQPLSSESHEMLALSAYVATQSRGAPIDSSDDPRLKPFIASGRALFMQRRGQLNLSCANCHDEHWAGHLAGSAITQGQPTGYPLYRLEWQSLGSLQRRLRNCMIGSRAEPYDSDAPEMVELELYLMTRAHDMPLETPAVRP